MSKKVDWSEIAKMTLNMTPGIFGVGFDLRTLLRDIKGDAPEIEKKAEKAAAALQEAALVVGDLKQSIEAEVQRVEVLKSEHEKYKSLAAIEEKNAKAIMTQLEEKLNEGKGRERWIALVINLVAGIIIFVLGVLVSPYLTKAFGSPRAEQKAEQAGAGQPATASESKSEDSAKPQPESEGRSR
jgi:hypothetical protein